MKIAMIGAAALLAMTAQSFAQMSTTTTTTTSGYYVVRDPATKKCTVTATKPAANSTTVVVGDTMYKTQTEADTAVTKVCTM